MELNDFIKNMIGFLESQLEPDIPPPPPPPPVYIPIVFKVATNVTIIDGRKLPYSAVKPGDVIELASGVRPPLSIQNIQGTAELPVIIKNAPDGIVEINSASGWYGFWFRNCHFFRFAGIGKADTEYGIKITRAQNNGIIFEKKTDHFEMDHIEKLRVDGSGGGIGIQGQTRLTNGTPDYDYNNDGVIDSADNITRENYVDGNWHIHHLKIDGGVNKLMNMALYVGNSNFLEENNPLVENVHIHDIIIRNVASKTFQVGSVIKGLDVHNIDIRNCATKADSLNPMAISINPGSNGKLYNCTIMDCGGYGIGWIGTGGHIFNNVIVRCGRPNTYYMHGIYVSYKEPWTHAEPTYVYNNTIINPVGYGITISNMLTGTKAVWNNIIVSPGRTYKSLVTGTVASNNHEVPSVDTVKFVSPSTDNYALLPESPVVNAGYDVSSLGITKDIVGTNRPLGSAYDIGAYERVVA